MIETARTWRLLRSLRAGSRASPEVLVGLQNELLRDAIGHAYDNVPFYRRTWDEAALHPRHVRDIRDLRLLPPLTGAVMRDAVERGELLARTADPTRAATFETSGSSGRPLRVYRRSLEKRLWRAIGLRIWFEHGFRWWHETAHFDRHPGAPHSLQRLGISRTTWISPELPIEQQLATLRSARPDVVAGTPTVLRRISEAIEADGTDIRPPRIAFCHGELLDTGTSDLIERALGVAPIELYGLTEVGWVAWQCELRMSLHVNADTCIVELLRDGRPARPGELGSIVVTDLRSRTMPLIRYDTGDLAVAATGQCPCGRTLPVLGSTEGRAREAVTLADGRVLTARVLLDRLAEILPPDRYHLRQEAPARFRLHLDPSLTTEANGADGRGTNDGCETRVMRRLAEILGTGDIRLVRGLPSTAIASPKAHPISSAVARNANSQGQRRETGVRAFRRDTPERGTRRHAPSGP